MTYKIRFLMICLIKLICLEIKWNMNNYGVCTTYLELEEREINEYKWLEEVGEYCVVLKFRGWGKNQNLICYFETENKQKICLSAWKIRSGEREGMYCPRDSNINFAQVKDGTRWVINLKVSKNNKVFWSTADEI